MQSLGSAVVGQEIASMCKLTAPQTTASSFLFIHAEYTHNMKTDSFGGVDLG